MELFQLRAFLAVAEELHFGQAAKKLGIAQPPLSRTIRQLEENLGAELFFRTTRSVSLSPAGRTLLAPARRILSTCRAAEDAIRLSATGAIGHVSLGFSGTSSSRLVAALTAAAKLERPGIVLDLETKTYAGEAVERLLDGTLDLALVRWTEPPPQLTGRPVMYEHPVAVVPLDHPLAGRVSVTLSEIKDEDFIFLSSIPRPATRASIMEMFLREGIRPRIVQEVPDNWIIGAFVSAGVGITVTYDSVVAGLGASDIATIPVDADYVPMCVYLAHHEDNPNPALREILAVAESALPTASAG